MRRLTVTSDPLPSSSSSSVPSSRRRWPWILLALIVVLAGLLFAGWRAALHQLESQVLLALGPEAELRELRVDWPGVLVIEGLRLEAPRQWPAQETLRADRVEVVPTLRSLVSERAIVNRVRIEGAYLSVLRTRAGKLELLPTLIERARRPPGSPEDGQSGARRAVRLDHIALEDAVVDYYDASVREPRPVNLRLVDVAATLEDLALPELDQRSAFKLEGRITGEAPPRSQAGKNQPPPDPGPRTPARAPPGMARSRSRAGCRSPAASPISRSC